MEKNISVKFPVGVKLAIIIGLIVLISLGSVTFLNSYFISQDVEITAENNNFSINTRQAITILDKLQNIRSATFGLLDLVNVVGSGRNAAISAQARAFFFERNQDIAAISVHSMQGNVDMLMLNKRFFIANEIDEAVLQDFFQAIKDTTTRSCKGETVAFNASVYFNMAMLTLLFPWDAFGKQQCCAITFSLDSISEVLGSNSINTTFVINDTGDILFHPDMQKVLSGASFINHPLVKIMQESNHNNDDALQVPYTQTGENAGVYYGAYQRLNIADITVMTCVPQAVVLEAVNTTRMNNIYLTLVVFFLSIILILIFSRLAISKPLRTLTQAAIQIKQGNFLSDIFEHLNTRRHDEIGVLNQNTKDEINFLTLFSKFTNTAVAKAIARGKIDFKPHLKDVTIFFSDIRGFTQIGDDFKRRYKEDSPQEIINFLNDYMSRMVECITLSGGNVDKFEGDAIMAVWGIMRNDNLDYETLPDTDENKKHLQQSHTANCIEDALNALRGTLSMRYSLMLYNKQANAFSKAHKNDTVALYKPHIRIGSGLNCGRSTCGIMGSKDKMEYTAIGDAVNFASRTESSTKLCGADILITQDMFDLLKHNYIRGKHNNFLLEEANATNEIIVEEIPVAFEVKGKGEQHFFAVVNMPHFDIEKFFKKGNKDFVLDNDCKKAVGEAGPSSLKEVRDLLGIPLPDYEKVNLNEAENKIKIQQ